MYKTILEGVPLQYHLAPLSTVPIRENLTCYLSIQFSWQKMVFFCHGIVLNDQLFRCSDISVIVMISSETYRE